MNYTIDLTEKDFALIAQKYQDLATDSLPHYTLFRAKSKSVALTIYQSYKLLIQGKAATAYYLEICGLLGKNPQAKKPPASQEELSLGKTIIGSDEVGCGDYFGGIIVVAAAVEKEKLLEAKKLGVRDSKKLTESAIGALGAKLTREVKHETAFLSPEKYNEMNKKGMNLNQIKAFLHHKAITRFKQKYPDLKYDAIVIDAFCSRDNYLSYLGLKDTDIPDVKVIEKAEDKYLSVGAASIIARFYLVKYFARLRKNTALDLPFGCGEKIDILIAKIIRERGASYLTKIAKVNFKNTARGMKIYENKSA